MRYLELAESLRTRIALGDVGPGGAIPSEAELGSHYGASRVTVRRALEVLRDEGLVRSRKGAGWFVAVDPVRQALGRFPTVEAALRGAGVEASRRVLEFRFAESPPETARALGLRARSEVLHVRRLTLAAGRPFALVAVWLPADVGALVSRAEVERSTFYDLLPAKGVPLGGVSQTIGAVGADRSAAKLLGVRGGMPLLACRRVTRRADGSPVIASEHLYAGYRTVLEVDFPTVNAALADGPPGLRLVRDGSGFPGAS